MDNFPELKIFFPRFQENIPEYTESLKKHRTYFDNFIKEYSIAKKKVNVKEKGICNIYSDIHPSNSRDWLNIPYIFEYFRMSPKIPFCQLNVSGRVESKFYRKFNEIQLIKQWNKKLKSDPKKYVGLTFKFFYGTETDSSSICFCVGIKWDRIGTKWDRLG